MLERQVAARPKPQACRALVHIDGIGPLGGKTPTLRVMSERVDVRQAVSQCQGKSGDGEQLLIGRRDAGPGGPSFGAELSTGQGVEIEFLLRGHIVGLAEVDVELVVRANPANASRMVVAFLGLRYQLTLGNDDVGNGAVGHYPDLRFSRADESRESLRTDRDVARIGHQRAGWTICQTQPL